MRISSRGILECEGRGCRAQLQSRALRLTIGGWDSNDGEENEQTKQGLDRRTVRRQLFDRRNGISAGQCHRPSPSRQHGRAWAAGSPDKAVPLSDVVSARPQIRRSADRICRRTRRNRAETAVNRPFPTKMGAPCVNAQIENLCLKSGLNSMKPSCNSFTSTGAPAVSCLIKLSCQASPAAGSETITLRTSTSWIRSGVGQGSGVRSGSLMSRGILVRGGGWGSGGGIRRRKKVKERQRALDAAVFAHLRNHQEPARGKNTLACRVAYGGNRSFKSRRHFPATKGVTDSGSGWRGGLLLFHVGDNSTGFLYLQAQDLLPYSFSVPGI